MKDFFKKESPILSMLGFGGGGTGTALNSAGFDGTPVSGAYMLIGGGGQGGRNNAGGGGGGAGGYHQNTSVTLLSDTYTITVGSGGVATAYGNGAQGGHSSIVGAVYGVIRRVEGGGGGGGYGAGAAGGGGGGECVKAYSPPAVSYGLNPGTPAPIKNSYPYYTPGETQGYNGGQNNNVTNGVAGSGGGTGASGSTSGTGGQGVYSPVAETTVGGGGGCSGYPNGPYTAGGPGGGGASNTTLTPFPNGSGGPPGDGYFGVKGTDGLGGGGGAGLGGSVSGGGPMSASGAPGGSGRVVWKVATSDAPLIDMHTNATVTTSGSNTLYTWTQPGTLRF